MTTSIYLKETKYEFLKRLRVRTFTVATLCFPLTFYILYGLLLPTGHAFGLAASTYLLATFGTFAVLAVCLFGVGVSVAVEQALGWIELKRATPMPPAAYFVAKFATCFGFSFIVVALMLALGLIFGHAQLSAFEIVRLVTILMTGVLPFGALGLVMGYMVPASSAPSFLNMLYLPMSFCSGLWVPLQFLPSSIRHIAQFLPSYHLSQLALAVIRGDNNGGAAGHWEALLAFTLLFLGLARLLYQRAQTKQNSVA